MPSFLYAGQLSLLAAVYFATAKLSLSLAIPPGYATAVWPPAGVALAAVLLVGNPVWPAIWLRNSVRHPGGVTSYWSWKAVALTWMLKRQN